MNKDLTVGKPETVLWRFCIPLFGSVIFQQLYNVADSFVCVGIILLGVWMVFFEEKQMPRQPYRWGAPKPAEETTGEQEHAHDPKHSDN